MLTSMVELGSGNLVLLDRAERRLVRRSALRPRVGTRSRRIGARVIAYPVRVFALADGSAAAVDADNERWLVIKPNGDVRDFFRQFAGAHSATMRPTVCGSNR